MMVYFGVSYEVYGTVGMEIPDDYKNKSDEEIQAYIQEHWDEVPLPDGDYVPESDKPDFDNFEIEEDE